MVVSRLVRLLWENVRQHHSMLSRFVITRALFYLANRVDGNTFVLFFRLCRCVFFSRSIFLHSCVCCELNLCNL